MPQFVEPSSGVRPCVVPGFELSPLGSVDRAAWWRGRHGVSGTQVVVRRIDGIRFADALRDLGVVIDVQSGPPAGMASSLAVLVIDAAGHIVADAVANAPDLAIERDAAAAAALPGDAMVDVLVVYLDSGFEIFRDAAADPAGGCAGLVALAPALDGLTAGIAIGGRRIEAHGGLDWPCLRLTPDGPALLGFGIDLLEATRRERLDAVAPWQTVAPERCLPPGTATPRGDQYALAVLWASARLGRPLFAATDAATLVRSKLSDAPPLDGLGPAERDVVARAMSAAADERFGSCGEFAAALAGVVGDAASGAVSAEITRSIKAIVEPIAANDPPSHIDPAATEPLPWPKSLTVRMTADPPANPRPEAPAVLVPASEVEIPPDPPVARTVAQPVALAAHPYKAGDLILPGYRLVKPLGKGGFGEVWKAAAPGGMSVAIKVIANLGRREGAREYRALQTVKDIRHAHIVPLFGVWLKASDGRILDEEEAVDAERRILSTRDHARRETIDVGGHASLENLELVIAMGLGEGTLYERFKRLTETGKPGVELGQLLTWMRQAALAIDHFNRGAAKSDAPGAAVQHCDIKPQNMLLVGDVVQVCDFGLARVQGEVRATANNLLSIAYAAPEMAVRPFDPSRTTDQYSLAVTYHELRTGRLPYPTHGEGESAEMSALEILKAKSEGITEVTGLPPAETRILLKALARDPDGRFGSCAEFIDALEIAVEQDAATESSPVTAAAKVSRSRGPVIGVAGGGIVAAALVAYLLLPGRTPTHGPQTVTDLQATQEPIREPAEEPIQTPPVPTATAPTPAVQESESQPSRSESELARTDSKVAAKTAPAPGEVGLSVPPAIDPAPTAAEQSQRFIEAVIMSAGREPAALGEAITRFESASAEFPPVVRERLGRQLAQSLVDRSLAGLRGVDATAAAADPAVVTGVLARSSADAATAARLDPDSWKAHDVAGRCAALRGRFDEAISAYSAALERFAANPGEQEDRIDILSRRGFAFLKQKRFAEAADDYLVFREGDPTLAAKLWDIQSLAAESGDLDAAITVLERLVQLVERQPQAIGGNLAAWEIRNTLAWYLACGPDADAVSGRRGVELARLALADVDPANRGQVLDSLAAAQARAGDFDAALRSIDEAIAATTDPGLLSDLERRRTAFDSGEPWREP